MKQSSLCLRMKESMEVKELCVQCDSLRSKSSYVIAIYIQIAYMCVITSFIILVQFLILFGGGSCSTKFK